METTFHRSNLRWAMVRGDVVALMHTLHDTSAPVALTRHGSRYRPQRVCTLPFHIGGIFMACRWIFIAAQPPRT